MLTFKVANKETKATSCVRSEETQGADAPDAQVETASRPYDPVRD
jgi:hypothetical protein